MKTMHNKRLLGLALSLRLPDDLAVLSSELLVEFGGEPLEFRRE